MAKAAAEAEAAERAQAKAEEARAKSEAAALEEAKWKARTEAALAKGQPRRVTKLNDDIRRWNARASQPKSFIDLIMPLGMFLDFDGYSLNVANVPEWSSKVAALWKELAAEVPKWL